MPSTSWTCFLLPLETWLSKSPTNARSVGLLTMPMKLLLKLPFPPGLPPTVPAPANAARLKAANHQFAVFVALVSAQVTDAGHNVSAGKIAKIRFIKYCFGEGFKYK